MDEMMNEEDNSQGVEVPSDGIDLSKYKEGETFELPAKFQVSNGSLTLIEVDGKPLGGSQEPQQSESDAMDARIMERAKMADKERMMM